MKHLAWWDRLGVELAGYMVDGKGNKHESEIRMKEWNKSSSKSSACE